MIVSSKLHGQTPPSSKWLYSPDNLWKMHLENEYSFWRTKSNT
jgi:hypothetical protein